MKKKHYIAKINTFSISDDNFLDIGQLAKYLNIKKRTLYHLVETMRMPHYRIGKLIRFKRCEIDSWMETKKQNPLKLSIYDLDRF
jgi:excisionase family DNA binding protein